MKFYFCYLVVKYQKQEKIIKSKNVNHYKVLNNFLNQNQKILKLYLHNLIFLDNIKN